MVIGVLALVGTRKGLFLLRGDDARRTWQAEGPLLGGWGVYHATVDARDGTIYTAANHVVVGPTVQRSADGGKTWQRSKKIGLPEAIRSSSTPREASASDADSLYFATQGGSFFALAGGDTWIEAAQYLPPILSVEVTQWSR